MPYSIGSEIQTRELVNMKIERIRALALCIVWRGEQILVSEGYDPDKPELFYRPLGGGIEFGERGHEAAAREMQEELGADLRDLRYLGTLESIFTYAGERGHEIIRLYAGTFTDPALYAQDEFVGHEAGYGDFKVIWRSLADFRDGQPPLYPDGLLEVLTSQAHR